MFYNDHCHTDTQKTIFKAIMELSKNNNFVAIQELDYLGIPRHEIEEILNDFAKNGLFKEVQRLEEDYPVIFRL